MTVHAKEPISLLKFHETYLSTWYELLSLRAQFEGGEIKQN